MTPEARIAAAIEILDTVLAGAPAEKALTNWGRGHRFAGSGDRRAIRDLVFDTLRQRSSMGAFGGGTSGRALMIGTLRAIRADPATVFTGKGHAPAPLTPDEAAFDPAPMETWPRHMRLDYPAWLDAALARSLGDDLERVMELLRLRAPVFLRVNIARATRDEAQAALLRDAIETVPHDLALTALLVTHNHRHLRQSRAYTDGLVELQDAASQSVVASLLPIAQDARVLDFCAGGGGKALAIAAACDATVFAHDAAPRRMADLGARAARAGVTIAELETGALAAQAPFDLVLADAPCSGSGAWRRQPAAKWELTPERLVDLCKTQAEILDNAAMLVAPSGRLAYATCSLLAEENADQVAAFLKRAPEWSLVSERQLTPLEGGDGFYIAQLTRET